MGKFVVKESKAGMRFNLVANNGEIIAASQVYKSANPLPAAKMVLQV